jgi:hypothetical protein
MVFLRFRSVGRLGFLRTTSLQIAHLRQRVITRKVCRVFVITALDHRAPRDGVQISISRLELVTAAP